MKTPDNMLYFSLMWFNRIAYYIVDITKNEINYFIKPLDTHCRPQIICTKSDNIERDVCILKDAVDCKVLTKEDIFLELL